MISNSTSLLRQGMIKKVLLTVVLWLILFCSSPLAQMSGTYTIGTGGNFSNLKAFFDNINTSGVSGNVTGNIISNLSESSSAVLNEVNYTGGPWTITIRPIGGSWVDSATFTGYLIDLSGADNVNIDGSIGGVKSLTLRNYSHTGSTGVIKFQNCATYNTLQNCYIEGSGTTNGANTVHFGNSVSGGIEGNSYNIVTNNDVRNIANTGTLPSSGITSFGTGTVKNHNNTITNNNIYNFAGALANQDAYGVYIHTLGNTGGWNISGNSIYYNAGLPTNGQGGIYLAPGLYKTDDNLIYGNYIGGSAPQCGGSPWINTGSSGRMFYAIGMVTVDTSSEALPTIIRKNTFKNIQYINNADNGLKAIFVANGKVIVDSNIIGDPMVSNSIISAGLGGQAGIQVQGQADKIVQNNLICNITATNSTTTLSVSGIIGSPSIGAPGSLTIKNNIVHHLKTFSASAGPNTPALAGILCYGNQGAGSAGEITGNTVYALVDSNTGSAQTDVMGICAGNYKVTQNLIYDLQNAGTILSPYYPPTASGIVVQGASSTLVANNMIILGKGISSNNIYNGIWNVSGTSDYNLGMYFNSIYISGTNIGGVNSFGFSRTAYYASMPTTTITARNNIFVNMRTGNGKHYVMGNFTGDSAGWGTGAFDYNLFNNINANTIGLWGIQDATFSSWKTISHGDTHSLVGDPQFVNADTNNLHISTNTPTLVESAGVPVAELTTDFDGDIRHSLKPDIGADEGNFLSTPVELTSFTAELSGSNVLIKWMTSTEINNKGFDIERKIKAQGSWEKIGYISGFGTTTESKTYSFTDNKITSGFYSYRLKQIDYDGTYKYSPEVEVNVLAPKEFSLSQNYPNPFNPSTIIKYALPFESNVKLTVYNLLGEVVDVLQNGIQEMGYYNISWNAANHSSGLYIYTIDAKSVDGKNSYSSTKKMMLVR